jgi:hypothetical protein
MVRFSSLQRAAVVLAAGIILGAASLPAYADKPLTNLGPVGPGEPILVTVGDQRVIAFYAPERGECAVSAIVWKDTGADSPATRVRLSLKPGQTLQLDSAQRKAMGLLCGADATSLSLVAPAELLVTGVADKN